MYYPILSMCAFIVLCPCSVALGAISVGNFNPLPQLPYDSTTLEQDELIKIASGGSDPDKSVQMAACQRIVQSPEAPAEIVRWATLRQITILTYQDEVLAAIQIGRDWLRDHSADPNAMEIRVVLAQLVSQRGLGGKPFPYELFDEIHQELFFYHSAAEPAVLGACGQYTAHLNKYSKELGWRRVREMSIEVLQRARDEALPAFDAAVRGNDKTRLEALQSGLCETTAALFIYEGSLRGKHPSQESVDEAVAAERARLEARRSELVEKASSSGASSDIR